MKLTAKYLLLLFAITTISFLSCKDDDESIPNSCQNISCVPDANCFEGICSYNNYIHIQDGNRITSDQTWTNNQIYVLKGKVVVENGATLTIQPGTIIKGDQGDNTNASALVIARGAKLNAIGTASAPIIFTSVLDNIQIGQLSGSNLNELDRGLWGGIIILGNAPISAKNGDAEAQIEGLPANESYGKFGGNNANDNSGTLSYISIRHGGIAISDGNEINGLTLGGVGAGTMISYVEVVGNSDDGVEYFGGTVNTSNVIVISQGDDGLDIDQNYAGQITNALVINGDASDSGFEIDGPEGTLKDGLFTIFNTTVRGHGAEDRGMTLKSKSQGSISNCVFENSKTAFRIRDSYDVEDNCSDKSDSYDNYVTNGTLNIINSEFVGEFSALVYTDSKVDGVIDCSGQITNEVISAAQNELEDPANNNRNVATATGGVDASQFTTWTWASQNNKL